MPADPNLRVATIAPRALHAEVRDPLGPAARVETASAALGRLHRRPRPVCYANLCGFPGFYGVKAIKFAGRAAGRGRRACRPETEARACLWAFLIQQAEGDRIIEHASARPLRQAGDPRGFTAFEFTPDESFLEARRLGFQSFVASDEVGSRPASVSRSKRPVMKVT